MRYRHFLILFSLVALITSNCNSNRIKNPTPSEYLNNVVVSNEKYFQDSVEVVKQLKGLIERHEKFFSSKEYDDSTQLIIDSIIYSPDHNKLVIFVITKNPTYKQLVPSEKYKWYYDATCYVGVRQENAIYLSLIGPNFTNSINKSKLIKMMRSTYFSKYAEINNSSGSLRYKYNIGDVRFWDCSIWQEIETNKQKRKEFEEFKITHPEDVYIPNNN